MNARWIAEKTEKVIIVAGAPSCEFNSRENSLLSTESHKSFQRQFQRLARLREEPQGSRRVSRAVAIEQDELGRVAPGVRQVREQKFSVDRGSGFIYGAGGSRQVVSLFVDPSQETDDGDSR